MCYKGANRTGRVAKRGFPISVRSDGRPKLTLHFAQQSAPACFLGEQPLEGTHRVRNSRGSMVESPRDGGRRKPGVLGARDRELPRWRAGVARL